MKFHGCWSLEAAEGDAEMGRAIRSGDESAKQCLKAIVAWILAGIIHAAVPLQIALQDAVLRRQVPPDRLRAGLCNIFGDERFLVVFVDFDAPIFTHNF